MEAVTIVIQIRDRNSRSGKRLAQMQAMRLQQRCQVSQWRTDKPFRKWPRDNCTSTGKKGIPPLTYATHKDDLKMDHTATGKASKLTEAVPGGGGV